MLRNSLPNLSKEFILDIRKTTKELLAKPHRYGRALTPWQILPVPSPLVDQSWHQVYQGRHRFIEARAGLMLVTAKLEAFHAQRAAIRPSAERWLCKSEVQAIYTDKADADGVALGVVARRGMNVHRIPTRWRVWFNLTGHINKETTSSEPWHRVYATTEADWLYIEVGHEHLQLRAHKELLLGREGWDRRRGAFGRIKIDRQEFVEWLGPYRSDGEIIIQN